MVNVVLPTFFENPLVSRVNRRIDIRMVRLCRSTYDVLMYAGFGSPSITFVFVALHFGTV